MALRHNPDEEFDDDLQKVPPTHLAVLTDKQRKFVGNFLANGNATLAAKEAGYGGANGSYASQRGYELMRMDKIRTAITTEQLAHGHALRSLALKVWQDELERDPTTLENRKLRMAAAKEVADRFGLVKITKTEGEVTHRHQFENMPTEEIEAFIKTKIRASKLIDDAEYTEIDAAVKDIEIPPLHVLKGLPAPGPEVNFQLPPMSAEDEAAFGPPPEETSDPVSEE